MPLTLYHSDRIDVGKWGHRYISVPMYLCTDCRETTLELKQVLIELAVIMWLSIPLLVATQCKLQQTLNDHPPSHSDNTSKLYEAKCKILCRAIKEQPTPVEGNVKGNKHKHYHFVSMTQITWPFPCPGCVPAWLSGRLLRNGPGMFEIGDTKYNYWFDGQALLHSFTIVNG